MLSSYRGISIKQQLQEISMLNILNIQDNDFNDSLTIDEAFKSCVSSDMTVMYGAYAFVTVSGFDVMFGETKYLKNLDDINLIIGVDSITNSNCIRYLTHTIDQKLFRVSAYVSDTAGTIFHPKFCILTNQQKTNGWLILGSGNLTLRGLRKNKEAFSVIKLSSEDIEEVLSTWHSWLGDCQTNIKSLDEPIVKQKARANDMLFRSSSFRKDMRRRRSKNKRRSSSNHDRNTRYTEEKMFDGWSFDDKSKVLIAEIPRASNRWNQANFNKDTYLDYFAGSLTTSQKEVVLRHVDPISGKLGDIENRPCVAVKSQNYRIELAAAAGLNYPENEAPIAVFINVGKRTFIYTLFMPTNNYYSTTLRVWVDRNWEALGGRPDRKCRIILPFDRVKNLLEPTQLFKYFEENDFLGTRLLEVL